MAESKAEPAPIVAGQHFKLVFLTIVALTIVFFLTDGILSWAAPSASGNRATFVSVADFAFKVCLGSVVGLLGGKATG